MTYDIPENIFDDEDDEPAPEPAPTHELPIGRVAWMIVKATSGKGTGTSGQRWSIEGAARVSVAEHREDGSYGVRVEATSGGAIVGRIIEAARHELHDNESKTERRAFEARVDQYWGKGAFR